MESQISGQQGNPAPVAPVQQGYFVDATSGNDATGSFSTGSPFATVQAAVASAGPGATVVVRPGNYTGAVTLRDGQRLIGEGFEAGGVAAVRPSFSGPITLADGNTVRGLRLRVPADVALRADGRRGGFISQNLVEGSGGDAQAIGGLEVTGDWTVGDNTVLDSTSAAIFFSTPEGVTEETSFRIHRNTLTGSAGNGIGFLLVGDSDVRIQVVDNTLTDNLPQGSFIAILFGAGEAGFELTGNTNDGVYSLANFSNGGVLAVEQLGLFEALNTGTLETEGEITDVPAGYNGFAQP